MFITTANLLDPVQPAFRDRMEVIRLAGYTEEEKQVIARRHLVPRQVEANGLDEKRIEFSENALKSIIAEYTREAGLRNLERGVARVCRKVARQFAEGRRGRVRIIASSLDGYLGAPPITREEAMGEDQVGAATGLAWTEAGGDVLFVEATTMRGQGRLILTGHLGDVMKESAQAALSYARAWAEDLGIVAGYFEDRDVHVHVPEGAIPKDGPSAGVTMATAMLSAFTNRPIRGKVAMTGEITLRGNVLPVGGIKEKVLAARRSGIRTLVLPAGNRKNLEEIPRSVRRDLRLVFVRHVSEVFREALAQASAETRVSTSREPAQPQPALQTT
jgi:ATP-dependent Lon protease